MNKQLRIEVELDPSLPNFVVGDQQRLRQVLLNLLFNAVKYACVHELGYMHELGCIHEHRCMHVLGRMHEHRCMHVLGRMHALGRALHMTTTRDSLRAHSPAVLTLRCVDRFTPQGRIVVTAALGQDFANHLRLQFAVEDTGIGIRQEDMQRLFGLFSKIRVRPRPRALGPFL